MYHKIATEPLETMSRVDEERIDAVVSHAHETDHAILMVDCHEEGMIGQIVPANQDADIRQIGSRKKIMRRQDRRVPDIIHLFDVVGLRKVETANAWPISVCGPLF